MAGLFEGLVNGFRSVSEAELLHFVSALVSSEVKELGESLVLLDLISSNIILGVLDVVEFDSLMSDLFSSSVDGAA
jgi:hypothetical protein